jgi:hypothetical protein
MILVHTLVGLTLLGLIVALISSLYFLKGEKPTISLVLALGGMLGGLVGAMIWIFATGGLEESAFMSIPSAICALLAVFLLMKFFGISIKETGKRSIPAPVATMLMFLSLTIVLVLSAAIPVGTTGMGGTSENVLDFDDTLRFGTAVSVNIGEWTSESWEDTVSIDIEHSSVRFPRISADNPNVGEYVEFEVTFSVFGGEWTQPYVKISPFFDLDGDGLWDPGDDPPEELWDPSDYKIALSNSGESSYWRTNCVWDYSDPAFQFNNALIGGVPLIMPVFHLSSWGSVWADEQGETFWNTPEMYTSPRDQMSWLRDNNNNLILQEGDTLVFQSVLASGSSIIRGKFFCDEDKEGTHGVLVQAFDMAQGQDPFDPFEVPLSQEVKPFTVGIPGDLVIDITISTWVATALLSAGTIGGAAVIASRYKPFIIKM